jgi:PAS domain S-box-containing protein
MSVLAVTNGGQTCGCPCYEGSLFDTYTARRSGRPRIVLADEDAGTRAHLLDVLAGRYQVRAVADGEAALAAIRSDPPDLVLSQVMMPRLDGFGLLRALRAERITRVLPVILLSAQEGEESRIEGMLAGADDFLVKPVGESELLARVGGALALVRSRQEALGREERQRNDLAAILEGMAIEFMTVDREWRITYLNAAAERTNGLARQEVLGKSHWEAFPNVLGTEFERELRRVMASRVPIRREIFFAPYGCWFEMDIQPIGDGGLAFYGRDISDRKRVSEALRTSEDRLRRTFELGLVGMAITSPAKGCIEVNDYLCEILGYTRDEFSRINWAEITHPDDLPADVAKFNQVLSGAIDGYTVDKRFIRKDGRFIDTILSTKCLRREDGGADYFVALVQDVTERKALLASEREARAIAEKSNQIKDEFLATLSHELRTPINAALMWLHLLRVRTFEKAAVEQAVDAVESSVRAQGRLIDDLLDLTRIVAGKLSIQAGPLDISAVVEAAMNAALPAATAKRIVIRFARQTQDAEVSGDGARLQQVFSNLLTNAIKFTPEGGRIDVDVRRVDSSLEVSLRDTGDGIDPELLPHVFERFRQADTSTTRAHTGLGLGLAIVKHLVELHGGRARAESEGKGRGATFVVSLPLLRRTTAVGEQGTQGRFATETDLSGVHVLLVDDDPSTQVALAHLLRAYNARADTASSVDEAMTKLASAVPDVLISDITMPGTDGYELIRQVRASHRHRRLPAIALTALSRGGERLRALRAGYDMHLAKPIDPTELVALVASLAR